MDIKKAWQKLHEKLFQKVWFTGVLLVLAALCLGALCLTFAVTAQRMDMLISYTKRPWTIALNLLPPLFLALLLWFLTNRAWLAYACTAALFFTLSLANWYKLFFRNDPLMFGDLFLVQEAGNMLGNYHLFLTPYLAFSIFLVLLGGAALFFCARGRFRRKWPRLAAAGVLLALLWPISQLYGSPDIYSKTYNVDHVPRWSATGAYISRGFLYPFFNSAFSAFETVPQGYDKKEAQAILGQYEDKPIPEGRQVDIIGVMLEAYNDFSKYPQIPFVQDPYEKFHALEDEAFTGDLCTNIFAAGTVNSERSFITGLRDYGAMRGPTNSYAWYLRTQGYEAGGSHSCYAWFYNRQNINPNMGLSPYYFLEDHYGAMAGGYIAQDKVLLPEIANLYRQQVEETGAPQLSFSVTYQGHGPYHTDGNDWGEDFVQPGAYSEESQNILNNYFGSVRSTSECLWDFVDSFRDTDRPVLVVLYGDHNPWLGDNNSVYAEAGIDLDLDTETGFLHYYCTRYMIWANDAAKELLGQDFTGEGPTIAPCFLMNQVFKLCGWDGPAYMQYANQLMEQYPVPHSTGAVVDPSGHVIFDPDDAAKEKLDEFQHIEYYMRHKFLYDSQRP